MRNGIKFFFRRMGDSKYRIPEELNLSHNIAEPKEPYQIQIPNSTERKGLVTSRVGQGAYRKSIMHRWAYQCAASGFSDTRVLIASHILPWKKSTDEQRLDVDNGILLSPDYDALFDKHLISFESSGKIILAADLSLDSLKSIGITGKEKIRNLTAGNKGYLDYHNNMVQ